MPIGDYYPWYHHHQHHTHPHQCPYIDNRNGLGTLGNRWKFGEYSNNRIYSPYPIYPQSPAKPTKPTKPAPVSSPAPLAVIVRKTEEEHFPFRIAQRNGNWYAVLKPDAALKTAKKTVKVVKAIRILLKPLTTHPLTVDQLSQKYAEFVGHLLTGTVVINQHHVASKHPILHEVKVEVENPEKDENKKVLGPFIISHQLGKPCVDKDSPTDNMAPSRQEVFIPTAATFPLRMDFGAGEILDPTKEELTLFNGTIVVTVETSAPLR